MAATAYAPQRAGYEPRRQARQKPQIRTVRGGRRFAAVRDRLAAVRIVLCAALFLGLVVSLLYSQVAITELTAQVESARTELAEAQSVNDYLSSSMDAITSRTNIEQIAEGRLSLVKADASQYTYIRLEDESVIQKTDSGAVKLFYGFRTAALSLIGSLDP